MVKTFWSVQIRNMDPSPSSSQLTGNSLVLAEADEPLLVENKVRSSRLKENVDATRMNARIYY